MTPQANFTSTSGVAEGAVPTRALKLPDDYMYDGWGKRFRYAVDPSATVAGSIPSMTLSCSPITINDSTGAVRSAAAIYALISHGANGHGAYTSNGVTLNAGSVNQAEQTNCHCTNTGVSQSYPLTTFQPSGTATGFTGATYVEKAPKLDPSNALDNFDDIVTFKESGQMQTLNNPVTPSVMYIADTQNDRIREVSATSAGIIATMAGNGTWGYTGDGGSATSAEVSSPEGIAIDGSGNLYIADVFNNVIRKVTVATGIITTVAGNGTAGHTGDTGPATSAELNGPQNVTVDSAGNIYIPDRGNNCVRKVTAATGIITTVAGHTTGGLCDASAGAFSGDGGQATSAKLNQAMGVAVDLTGNLYIADRANMRVRKVTASTGIITTIAGNGGNACTGSGGAPTSAQLWYPNTILVDRSNNIYIGTGACSGIWKITAATGLITTIGNGTVAGMAVDNSGNFYTAGGNGQTYIRKITPSGAVCYVAGNGTNGFSGDGGAADSAALFWPNGVAVFNGR
jgi:sugar lactone lactonase YvrE